MKKISFRLFSSALMCGVIVATLINFHPSNSKINDSQTFTSDENNLPVSLGHAKYVIDVNDSNAIAGYADYVFVGYVKNKLNTEYLFPNEEIGNPRTNYSVKVIKNIKGNLTLKDDIIVKKTGGIAKNGESIFLFDGDILPEKGKLYIFSANATADGSLFCSVANSCVPLDESLKADDINSLTVENAVKNLDQSSIVKEYKTSVKNEKNMIVFVMFQNLITVQKSKTLVCYIIHNHE